jgi:hypothetical protein
LTGASNVEYTMANAGAVAVAFATVAYRTTTAEAATPEVAGTPPHWEWSGWGGGFFWSCAWNPADRRVLYLGGDVADAYRSLVLRYDPTTRDLWAGGVGVFR